MTAGSHRKAASSCCTIIKGEHRPSVSGIQVANCGKMVVAAAIMGILRA